MRMLTRSAARLAIVILSAALFLLHLAQAQTGTLKVLDWNTHHGVGTDGVYDLQRFVTWIVRSGAQWCPSTKSRSTPVGGTKISRRAMPRC